MEKNGTKQKTVFVVGLGNPGDKYQDTPHNAGFLAVDVFARKFEFPEFKMEPDGILVSKKEIRGMDMVLAKPQMLMNNSGKALAKLFNYRKIRQKKSWPNLWVVNDDLDILLGKIKVSQNRGAAGHKGVQSIIDYLKTKNFVRFRVGIAPQTSAAKKIPTEKFVLKKIPRGKLDEFAKTANLTISAIETALTQGIEKAMTEYNQ